MSEVMKKLILVSIFFVALVPMIAFAGTQLTIIQGANCDEYWQTFTLDPPPDKICSVSGEGRWAWGDKTSVILPELRVAWHDSCNASYQGGGGTLNKIDWCEVAPLPTATLAPTEIPFPTSTPTATSKPIIASSVRPTSTPIRIFWTEMQRMGFEILRRIRNDLGIPENIGEVWAAQYPPYSWMSE